ncbi:MAG: efflux RND transporter permease subunit [Bacteroidota bacterium]
MTISDISVKRPVLATVLAIAIVIFGAVSFLSLGVREYPSVDPPIITVRTDYTGANAQIMESQITEPLEEAINRVDGIKRLSSISSTGRSTITVEFELTRDLDNAANDVRDRVAQAVRNLPPDADPPIVSKADADAQTILTITLSSQNMSLLELTDIAQNIFAERLQTIEGVSQINIWGEKRYAMRLILDPQKMQALNITTMDIRNALGRQNVELPSGQVEGQRKYITIQTYGRLNTEEEYNNMIVARRDNTIIRLRDVGRAVLGAQNENSILRGNGAMPMVGVAMQPQPGSNYIEIVDEAYSRVEMLKRDIPDDITIGVGLDITDSIRSSITDVQYTILVAFLLVLFIIFVFLRSFRTTFIPIITIPISLLGSFIFLYVSGFSINVLTLLGLLLATGLVVDDAIVMMENIYAKIEQGMKPIQAAFKGARQVFFAIISTTVTLVSVFMPLFFLQGLTGRLFREFAMVVAGAVIISTVISLTFTVMLSSRMLKKSKREYAFLRGIRRPIDYVLNNYPSWLQRFMKYRIWSFPVIVVMGVVIYLLFNNLPTELAPQDDKSSLIVLSTAPEGTSYEMMDAYQLELLDMLDTIPEIQYLLSVTSPGFGASVSVNTGFLRLKLHPPGDRERTQMELAEDLRPLLARYNMAQSFVVQPPTIGGGQGGGRAQPIQYVLQAPDLARLEEYLPVFMERAREHPMLDAVNVDLRFTKPEIVLDIDRDKAMDMGISVRDVAETLQTYFSEQRVGFFIRDGKQYFVIARAERSQRSTPQDISAIHVRTLSGEMVSLENIVTLRQESLPPQLLRFNRYSSATVSATPAEGYTLGDGIEAMNEIAAEVLDETFLTALTGTSADFAESADNLLLAFIFALLLIYLTLAAQFESFRDPLTIMFTVPLALAGALLSLWIFGQTINIFSQIGMIVLVGIVTKNGILIVEFANQKRLEGKERMEAVLLAAAERVRPIIMTSLATVLGALPLVISLGGAANSRIPMGVAIIGGLLFSLVLTLFIIPALYSFIATKNKSYVVEED